MEPFIGQIIMFGGNFAPRAWAYCDGQLLSIAQNQALFSILGTTYGGDGRTTFALPDLRGRTPIHAGTGPGLTPRRLGQRSGSEVNVMSVTQMPNHTHLAAAEVHVSSDTASQASPEGGYPAIPSGRDSSGQAVQMAAYSTTVNAKAGSGMVSVTVGNTGGQQPQNNMQPYLAVHYIIALQGTFPSRN